MTDITTDDVPHNSTEVQNSMLEEYPVAPGVDDVDAADSKASRKREREVSIEPSTPKPDEPSLEEHKERRTPAKKNRLGLDTTEEEDDETPPPSPNKSPLGLPTSPPHETKVRQISMKVRGMRWEDKTSPDASQETHDLPPDVSEASVDIELEPAAEVDVPVSPKQPPQDSAAPSTDEPLGNVGDSKDNPEPLQSQVIIVDSQESKPPSPLSATRPLSDIKEPASNSHSETAKRGRDESDHDDNPRERKRPSPPPDKEQQGSGESGPSDSLTDTLESEGSQSKTSGFLAYAATKSPFGSTKGPSVFGQKNSPSPSPLASTSNGKTSFTSSAFSIQSPPSRINSSASIFSTSPPKDSTPTGIKRTGFEAFAGSASPFQRSKSPPIFGRGSSTSSGFARSRSPSFRGTAGSINAFKTYASGGSQAFGASSQTPPVKKARQDSGSEVDEERKNTSTSLVLSSQNSPDGSEEEGDKKSTFSERLRAGKDDGEDPSAAGEDDAKAEIVEQEVHTGEEEEDTIFQVRCKLYHLSEQNTWKERGTGLLKLNVRKSDGRGARMLMRKEAVYTLLLNVPLFKGMKCTLAQDPRYVRFSCIERGTTSHYNLRLANAKVAGELLEEITASIPCDEPSDPVP